MPCVTGAQAGDPYDDALYMRQVVRRKQAVALFLMEPFSGFGLDKNPRWVFEEDARKESAGGADEHFHGAPRACCEPCGGSWRLAEDRRVRAVYLG